MDGSKPETFVEAEGIAAAFGKMSDKPFVVAVTRSDRKDCASCDKVRKNIDHIADVDIVRCDARKLKDVKDVLLALLERVMERAEALEKTG